MAETDFVEILSMVIDLNKVNLVGVECKEEEDFKVIGGGELGWLRRGSRILVEIDMD